MIRLSLAPGAALALLALACTTSTPAAGLGRDGVTPSPREAPACRQPGEDSEYTLDYLRDLLSTSDPQRTPVRDSISLSVLADTAIVLVTNEATCARAIPAYERALGRTRSGRSVHVYRAGASYVVEDPAERVGEHGYLPVFTSSFALIRELLR
ncbi:MAG TPA: hypothetical protein VFS05_08665 [Gemmatimonadaceae bacterium]|nr:hypothetical protein [Gemmatimonadaceae bacterium]